MNIYLYCFIFGLILFLILNSINTFSVGIPTEEEEKAKLIKIQIKAIEQELLDLEKLEAELAELEEDEEDLCTVCLQKKMTNPTIQNTCFPCYNIIFISKLKLYLQQNDYNNVKEYLDAIKGGKVPTDKLFNFIPPDGMHISDEDLEKLNIFKMLLEEESRILLMNLIVYGDPLTGYEDQLINEGDSPIMLAYWQGLSDENQADLMTLGWTKESWNGSPGQDADETPYKQNWSTMTEEQQTAAIRLGKEFVNHYIANESGTDTCEVQQSDQEIIQKYIQIAEDLGFEIGESDFTGISECCGGAMAAGGAMAGGAMAGGAMVGGAGMEPEPEPHAVGGMAGMDDMDRGDYWPTPEKMNDFIQYLYMRYNQKIPRRVIEKAVRSGVYKSKERMICYLERNKGYNWEDKL